ncbi:MAG: hypothetical protein L0323_03580 [Planctomycetes bacterium]|nr:hypothetical protein [Planctomycetota bacterium]
MSLSLELICFLLGVAGLTLASAQRRRPLQNFSMLLGWSGLVASVWLRQDQVMTNVRAELVPLRNDLSELLNRLRREPSPALLNILARISRKDVVAAEVLQDAEEFRAAVTGEAQNAQRRWLVASLAGPGTPPAMWAETSAPYLKRAKAGEIEDVRRLVSIPTESHLEECVALLKALGGAAHFEFRVWSGGVSPVAIELIVSDENVLLAFGGEGRDSLSWAIRMRDPKAADSFAECFQRLWEDEKTVVVKRGKALGRGEVEQAEAALRRLVRS